MSAWMRLVSELKSRSPGEYLTPTQRRVLGEICELLRFPNRINLYGSPGSGKTYIAWELARVLGATHVVLPKRLNELQPPHEILLIDNARHYESEVRRLLAGANLLQAKAAVIITHEPVSMPMYRLHLPIPNPDEVRAIITTYQRLGFFSQNELQANPNLWDILLACV